MTPNVAFLFVTLQLPVFQETSPWVGGAYRSTSGLTVRPAGFQSYFGPVFPHYVPIPHVWNRNVYSTS